jgi:phosphatidylserine/phosphatidylglycerophosphate/cardiolipin synthase-like enzyme
VTAVSVIPGDLQRRILARYRRATALSVVGAPIYVHAKVCVIDDTWATVGSDNFNHALMDL